MPELVAGVGAALARSGDTLTISLAGGSVTPQQFGAVGDGVTNDGAAFVAAIAYLKGVAGNLSINGFYKGSPRLFIPAGHYFLGTTTLDLTHTLVIEGEGSGRFFGAATRLRWSAGATGIRTQRHNTSGVSTVDGTDHFGGDGLVLSRLKLEGPFAGTEGEFHGLHAKTRTTLDDMWIYGFQGDGIHASAHIGSGGADEGDCSNSAWVTTRIESCRRGVFISGQDANVIDLTRLDLVANRQAGAWIDSGVIGPIGLRTCHASANGVAASGLVPTQSSFSGNRYAVAVGQEVGASTNAPSGTTADNTWWLYIGAGAADTSQSIIAWTSGLTWRAGGGYVVNNDSAIVGVDECYQEDGQFSQFGQGTLIVGGAITESFRRGGVRLRATAGKLHVDQNLELGGSLAAYSAGFQVTNGSVALGAGWALFNNGLQVVGARQTGTPADATDLATALTLVNALKAKLIAHGLIS